MRVAPQPGIYPGLPMAAYLAMPAASASLLHTLSERCPYAAWFESWLNPKPVADGGSDVQDAGSVAHALLLEGNADVVQIVDAPDWRKDAAKAARDAARETGKIPVLVGRMPQIIAMVESARAFIESLRESEPAIWMVMQPSGGESEVTMVWQERDGTLLKMRPDRISHDRRVIVDYKTTGASAEPDSWFRWQATKLGYPMSSAHYRRGVEVLCNVQTEYVWLVQEQDAPYLCSLVALDPAGRDLATRKALRARQSWAACASTGRWPSYPNRVAYPETPPWEFAREEERASGVEQNGDLMGREFAIARDSVGRWNEDERAPAA